MTSQPVKPVAKSVYICDDVIAEPTSRKVTVINLWDTVRVPITESFPSSLVKLVVFVWWRDGLGKVKTRVEIVQAATQTIIKRTTVCVLEFNERNSTVYGVYRLSNCDFPEPGYYYIEVYCEDQFVDDQIIHVVQD